MDIDEFNYHTTVLEYFLNQAHAWFLKIDPVQIIFMCVCVCVCMCVCPPLGY